MSRTHHHHEHHRLDRIGWLRAAVLGANDGILSTASLLVGMATAQAATGSVLLAGMAGLVAGAMSMAAGEYVSVRSQADSEFAELELEREELASDPAGEHKELTEIYVRRGLERALAHEVAGQLMRHDALGAHARDELGLSETTAARPVQAAAASAVSFASGAILPILAAALAPRHVMTLVIIVVSLLALAILGAASARLGGASQGRGVLRMVFWGVLAMGLTAAVGHLFGMGA